MNLPISILKLLSIPQYYSKVPAAIYTLIRQERIFYNQLEKVNSMKTRGTSMGLYCLWLWKLKGSKTQNEGQIIDVCSGRAWL
jgi:hypothetical protein